MTKHTSKPCEKCGQPIFFARTRNDKLMPLDSKPEQRGIVTIDDTGEPCVAMKQTYMPHWATCPHADSFRR